MDNRQLKIDKVEGAGIERRGKVDFLTKFVRHDKQDEKQFNKGTGKSDTWNMDVSQRLNGKSLSANSGSDTLSIVNYQLSTK